MVDFYPQPFAQLCERAFLELEQNGQIFDLPRRSFYRGDPTLDTSVVFQGKAAGTPLGPASGPQSQLVPNIVLSWLAGSRIIELKTVQIMDTLEIPRPCIDAKTIGYNVEWSQELRVEQSLHEYVAGSMLVEILQDANVLEQEDQQQSSGFQLDLSLGYDLAGISSEKICKFLHDIRNAQQIVDELRMQLPPRLARYKDFEFRTNLLHNITLSTFHGCPADEIESIVRFLLFEQGIHMTIKMNPSLYGHERTKHLLHDVMGYTEIKLNEVAFERDIQWDMAVQMVRDLKRDATAADMQLAVKFSNTLEVVNPGGMFEEEIMYLSGEPLHVITSSLASAWREVVPEVPISFSAGVDQKNFADLVACDYKPVTTCTDLLRPGGYARLPKYMARLEKQMKKLEVDCVPDYILAYAGLGRQAAEIALAELRAGDGPDDATLDMLESGLLHAADSPGGLRRFVDARDDQPFLQTLYARAVELAGIANTPRVVEQTQADKRYRHEKTKKEPRKIDSTLTLFDCITCDKCIPVCPNDANFTYELGPMSVSYSNYRWDGNQLEPIEGGTFELEQSRQIANFADYCNECGNCDIFCPEHGGPYIEKPSIFSSQTSYDAHTTHEGFFVQRKGAVDTIIGRLGGREFKLTLEAQRGTFDDGQLELDYDLSSGTPTRCTPRADCPTGHVVDMRRFHQLRALLSGLLKPDLVHYVNIPYLEWGAAAD